MQVQSYLPPTVFKFDESLCLRVFNQDGEPWFPTSDIEKLFGITNIRRRVAALDDDEKAQIDAPQGGLLSIVNESGFWTLVLRSDSALKHGTIAYKARKWVTSEVLPSIRKTGRYELPRDTITPEEQHRIRKAVASNASRTGRSFQTVYNSLYDEFQIPRYQELKREDFQKALEFLDFKFPEKKSVPEGSVVLDETEAQILLTFVYSMRYLYRGCFTVVYKFLEQSHSPLAGRFCECINDIHLAVVEKVLDDHGYSVKDMDCYKHLISHEA